MEPTSTMTSLLTNIGSIVTSAVGWIQTFITTVTASGNEILLLAILFPFVFIGISLLKRLISVRA